MSNNLSAFDGQAWSKRLITKIDQINIMLKLVNKDYEGELQNIGDTVQVRTPGNISMASYTKGATVSYQNLQPAKEPFTVSDAEYFAFEVDDIDRAQNDINAMDVYMKRAVVAMNNTVESKILTKGIAGVYAANVIGAGLAGTGAVPGTVTVVSGVITAIALGTAGSGYLNPPTVVITDSTGVGATATAAISAGAVTGYTVVNGGQNYTSPTATAINADPVLLDSGTTSATGVYQQFVKARTALSKLNVPYEGRWSVVDPGTVAFLLEDTAHFVRATEFGDRVVQDGMLGIKADGEFKPGLVGRCSGFDVYECPHIPQSTLHNAGGAVTSSGMLFGDAEAITYAAQISQIEALRLQTTFANAVRGLLLHDATTFAESSKRLVWIPTQYQ